MEEMNINNTAEQTTEIVEKKPKKPSKSELLENRIKELSEKKKSELSLSEKIELAELKEKARRAEANKKLKELKKAAEAGKEKALLKNLQKNGIKTENELKAMLSVFNVVKEFNIHDVTTLKKALEAAKEVSPELFR